MGSLAVGKGEGILNQIGRLRKGKSTPWVSGEVGEKYEKLATNEGSNPKGTSR